MRAATLAFVFMAGCTTTMRISLDELQANMARRFPVEIDKRVAVLKASDPRIELLGAPDKVAIRLRVDASSASGDSRVHGTIRVEGRIEYVAAEHAFYLREPRVTELAVEPPEGDGTLSRSVVRATDTLGNALVERAMRSVATEVVRREPLYRLDANRSKKEAKAIRHLRSVHTDGDDIVLEIGW
jgi:hypothetical protein